MVPRSIEAPPPARQGPRLCWMVINLGYYHHARIEALARRAPGVTVVELCGGSSFAEFKFRGDGAHYELDSYLPDLSVGQVSAAAAREVARRALERLRPEMVCIQGWASPFALSALGWCLRHRVPAIVTSETQLHDERRRWWKEAFKRRVVSCCAAGLVGGKPHAAYLASLGMPRERIFTGYDAVDNDHFRRGADEARAEAAHLRALYALPQHYFLASGRFIEKKNLAGLISAFGDYRRQAGEQASDLVILGGGPLRAELENLVQELSLGDHVHLPGFRSYDVLPAYYALAEAFVHASTTEQWGLVVNEAMAAGLPVIVSERCGCAAELVEAGRNGYRFDPTDLKQLTQHLCHIASDVCDRASMGAASRAIVARWGPDAFADGMERAMAAARQAPAPRAKLLDRLLLGALSRGRKPTEPR